MARTFSSPRHQALAKLLKQRRKAAGLTQTDLALRLDRPQSYVTDIERGVRRVDLVEFLNLSETIGFDPLEVVAEVRES